ncbi:MAG: Extracellular solute-binding protein family 1 [Candidatus Wolfebacteria bacterium GW2011_GWC2_46_275]|nr:MAG: Extracellular solute-binding protein family 1 [Candidatus Wolfebacteria bacterium GW2011_GWC2_46_275]KKU42034.1 MAG: Extracellular solute-binding protein family 1 [Candidatus Wolfebacteria bacterium GW2011_GWB2_46_69]KKU54429.1 MAG: Extracellular solute-binding protein family 1 [Candidatus Wolfebacteria bacterium GW2011_GWC1_47_103]KKU59757.1 MAG: Extracellular solute-binding protein family 1 [Candidatus Wolfebacteria bacterium GW2011_GWE2_47_12]KKU65748.1 MAG: Extracellular solute-bind
MIIGGVILTIALFVGIFIFLIPSLQQGSSNEPTSKIALTVWGVEDSSNFSQLATQYTAAHPNVALRYTQIPEDRYERTILNAFATGQAPDILMIHRSWVQRYSDKIMAADYPQIQPSEVRSLFPDVVYRDFVYLDYVFALPLYIDTPALIYNKELFNKKGVAVAPATWADIKTLIPYFTEFTAGKQLKKSAIAIGGTQKSIPNAPDIMSLLMFQFGSSNLETTGQRTSFDEHAQKAIDFYAQFATPNNPNYTWSDSFANADNAFGSEDVAMTITYSREIPALVQKNPYLSFDIFPMPQQSVSNPTNYADYWGLAVSAKSPNLQWAWKAVIDMTTDSTLASTYLQSSNNPPALRSLINESLRDPRLGVFARQSLTARAPFQYEVEGYRTALSRAVESILTGQFDTQDALQRASVEINNLF